MLIPPVLLIFQGTQDERIILTTAEDASTRTIDFPDIRLVDGPTILAGRVQIRHNAQWRSVCTNSRKYVAIHFLVIFTSLLHSI